MFLKPLKGLNVKMSTTISITLAIIILYNCSSQDPFFSQKMNNIFNSMLGMYYNGIQILVLVQDNGIKDDINLIWVDLIILMILFTHTSWCFMSYHCQLWKIYQHQHVNVYKFYSDIMHILKFEYAFQLFLILYHMKKKNCKSKWACMFQILLCLVCNNNFSK